MKNRACACCSVRLVAHRCCGIVLLVTAVGVQSEVLFENSTGQSGIEYRGTSWGAAWGDLNGDGYQDLFVGNHGEMDQVYLNQGNGQFKDVSEILEDRGGDTHTAAWADFDNDGDEDLIVLRGGGSGFGRGSANSLLMNDGGRLIAKGPEYGLDYPYARSRSPLWFDWNNDGRLDVLLVNINERETPPQAPTRLFSWNPESGRFKSEKYLLHNGIWTRFAQLVVRSQALPGSPVIVMQEFRYPDAIYAYDETGFRPVKRAFNFPSGVKGGGDIALGDFDNDLFVDFLVGGVGKGATKLLLQSAGQVIDASVQSGLSGIDLAQSVVAADFDNDMDLDVYVARGFNRKTDLPNFPNALYENLGDGVFQPVSVPFGAEGATRGQSESATTVDYDNDGFMDIFLTNGQEKNKGPSQLFRNIGNNNSWLTVELVGTESNRDGIGARVLATVGGVTQLREQVGGIHRNSQNDHRLHFGLGRHTHVENLMVYWPSGRVQELKDLSVNQLVEVTEGVTLNAQRPRLIPGEEHLTVNLTDEGDLDWVQWGAVRSTRSRKSGVTPQIGELRVSTSGTYRRNRAENIEFIWNDGPNGEERATHRLSRYRGAGAGVGFTVSAAKDLRRLKVYTQVRHARVRFEARLNDGGMKPIIQTIDSPKNDVHAVLTYEFSTVTDRGGLEFNAVVEDTYGKPWGNIAFGAAALSNAPLKERPIAVK